jgi:hypothetical protein
MPTLAEQEQYDQGVRNIASKYAPRMAADSRQGFSSSFQRHTGKTQRSHKSKIKEDRRTGEVYAFGVTAKSVGFILAQGQQGQTRGHKRTSRSGNKYSVQAHSHRMQAKPYIFTAVAKYAKPISEDLAKVSAQAIVSTSRYITNR